MEKIDAAKTDEEEKAEFEQIKTLIARTDKKNPQPEDLERLRRELDGNRTFYRAFGNLGEQIFSTILTDAVSDSAFRKECAERYIEEMKDELGYYSSTFVEKMLIDEIVMRWLRLAVTDSVHKNATYGSHTVEEGMYCDKRLHLAQQRYLRATETLVKVRRLIADTQAKGAKMFKDLRTEKFDEPN